MAINAADHPRPWSSRSCGPAGPAAPAVPRSGRALRSRTAAGSRRTAQQSRNSWIVSTLGSRRRNVVIDDNSAFKQRRQQHCDDPIPIT